MVKRTKYSILFLIGLILSVASSGVVFAVEIEAGIGPAYWQYQESSEKVIGIAATPMSSSASGYGLLGHLSIKGHMIDETWGGIFTVSGMKSMRETSETWSLANANQTNDIDITQGEFRGTAVKNLGPVRVGFWGSYHHQEQSRSHFIVNGVLLASSGEPIVEKIKTVFGGVRLESENKDAHIQVFFDAGFPLWVETTNSALPGALWSTTNGYLVGAQLEWHSPWKPGDSELSFNLAYQYRELGGQQLTQGLWPKNSFQLLSAEAVLAW